MDRLYVLTDSLHEMAAKMTDADKAYALDALEWYRAQFTEMGAVASAEGNAVGLASGIHVSVDEAIASQQETDTKAQRITCGKGCAYCCHNFVGVFPHEAALALAYAEEQGLMIDDARLARQDGVTTADWKHLAPEDQVCVFLQPDQTCGVYDHRPAACRKYFSIDEPIKCKTETHVWRWAAPMAEIITTAAYTALGMVSLATGLRKAKAARCEKL